MGKLSASPSFGSSVSASVDLKSRFSPAKCFFMDKLYVDANQLLDNAFELGFRILDSGYQPDLLLAIWRGGTPVGIGIQELLTLYNIPHRHCPIRTCHYADIDQRHDQVLVEGLETALASSNGVEKILIVDDVHDTGLSIAAVIDRLTRHFAGRQPEIRVATPYFKPNRNKTARQPDYYLHATEQWIVFPHELIGLSTAEILANKTASPALAHHLKNKPQKSPD